MAGSIRVGRCLRLLALAFLFGGIARPGSAEPIKNVLVLYSDDRLLPANVIIDERLRDEFRYRPGDPFRIQYFSEFLDVSRFPGEEHEARVAAFFRDKYAGYQLDLILDAGPRALDFLLRNRPRLFPGVPIVFCSAGGIDAAKRREGVTGVRMNFDPSVAPTLELALRLHPRTRRVVVVSGTSPGDQEGMADYRRLFATYQGRRGLEFTYLAGRTLPAVLTELSRLSPDDTVVFYITMFRDGAGNTFLPRHVMDRLAEASRAPIYGCYSTYLGRGIVGGVMTTFEAQGDTAARLARRVLSGEDPDRIPIAGTPLATVVDARQLRRWDVPSERLPAGVQIRFPELNPWQEYRMQIVGAGGLFAAQSALLAAPLFHRMRRRRAEDRLRESDERMRLATEAASLGMWSWCGGSSQLQADTRSRELFGLPPEGEASYAMVLERVHPADRDAVNRAVQRSLADETEFDTEFRVLRPDGGTRLNLTGDENGRGGSADTRGGQRRDPAVGGVGRHRDRAAGGRDHCHDDRRGDGDLRGPHPVPPGG